VGWWEKRQGWRICWVCAQSQLGERFEQNPVGERLRTGGQKLWCREGCLGLQHNRVCHALQVARLMCGDHRAQGQRNGCNQLGL
jgi:hypothetical protein